MTRIPLDALTGYTSEKYEPGLRNLLHRWQKHHDWIEIRGAHGVEPYSKVTTASISPETTIRDRKNRKFSGINFASQEYLSLSRHPDVIEAGKLALESYGAHSAGSAALMGITSSAENLERELASFLDLNDCTVFPTGWGAGYGLITTLVRPTDYVVIDLLAHACLREGAGKATGNILSIPHNSLSGLERRLKRIRADDKNAGILVVTESVFSMDSTVSDITGTQEICSKYGATLMLDVAHDLGCIGQNGGGYMEVQNMLGKVDIVMGSFSKTFASNGGFVATNHPALKLALRYNCGPLTFTNAMSPVQAAVVRKCLEIIKSEEGVRRRSKLMENIVYFRDKFTEAGFEIRGGDSAIIPVILGDSAVSRLTTKHAYELGGLVNLVEYPAVSKNTCRWRCQVMSDHSFAQIDRFVEIALEARTRAERELSGTAPAAVKLPLTA